MNTMTFHNYDKRLLLTLSLGKMGFSKAVIPMIGLNLAVRHVLTIVFAKESISYADLHYITFNTRSIQIYINRPLLT
jgi:hypothetical protein